MSLKTRPETDGNIQGLCTCSWEGKKKVHSLYNIIFFKSIFFLLFLENLMQTAGLNKQEQHKILFGKVDASCEVVSLLKSTFSSMELSRRGDFPYYTGGIAMT